jgi:hypothetical protein
VFVENATSLRVHVGRASLEDNPKLQLPVGPEGPPPADHTRRFATITVHEAYAFERASAQQQGTEVRLVPAVAALPPELELTFETTATNGTSVTAIGLVEGSGRGKLARAVTLRVGPEAVELVARSPRIWVRGRAGLEPSPATPFEPFPLAWTESFGGEIRIAPGVDARTGLPHAGFVLPDLYNPSGKGLVLTDDDAEGRPLPRIELLSDQLVRPTDRPIPGNLAPCTTLFSMRWRNPFDARTQLARRCHASPFLGYHAGSLHCVFDDVQPGTAIAVLGLFGGDLGFDAPAPRSVIHWDGFEALRRRGAAFGTRLRTLCVDTEQRVLHALVQHTCLMPDDRLPRGATLDVFRAA